MWGGKKGDNRDIYVKLIGPGSELRLTTHPGDDFSPAWSPDGLRIAFVRHYQGEASIFIVPALGGAESRVRSESSIRADLDWSPDGEFLAFSAQSAGEGLPSIFLLSLETRETSRLTSPLPHLWGDHKPAFSPDGPDGQTLAFLRETSYNTGDIYLVPVAGGEPKPKRLTFDNLNIRGLAWTPNGRNIVFSSNRGGSQSLWRISTSGGDPELAGVGENAGNLSISRLGNRLAYVRRNRNTNIWRVAVPRLAAEIPSPTKFISSTRSEWHPQFSPDGSKIAFVSTRSGSHEIWMCDSDSSKPVQLTFFGGPVTNRPQWSHDSKKIAFHSRREGQNDIFVVRAEAGAREFRLTKHPSDDSIASWSRNGHWVYFESSRTRRSEIWKVPAEGGRAELVTKQGGAVPYESPDGKSVYYVRGVNWLTGGIEGGTIRMVPVEGGPEAVVHELLKPASWDSWAVVQDGIYFVNANRRAIEFFSFETRQIRPVVTVVNEKFGGGLTVSPNRQWILYTQVEQDDSDIMLVENFR